MLWHSIQCNVGRRFEQALMISPFFRSPIVRRSQIDTTAMLSLSRSQEPSFTVGFMALSSGNSPGCFTFSRLFLFRYVSLFSSQGSRTRLSIEVCVYIFREHFYYGLRVESRACNPVSTRELNFMSLSDNQPFKSD